MASVLYDDLLLAVLERCDVRSVLAMGRASVHFHALSRSKQVWRTLVWDLASRILIDFYLGARKVEDLTVDELIDEVKRCVVGPKTWVPRRAQASNGDAASTAKPRLLRRKNLPKIHRPADLLRVTLLPGEKFIFLASESCLEVRDTVLGTVLWTWQQGYPQYKTFALEMPSDDVLMLLLYPRSGASNDMQLIHIDLPSRDSAIVFKVRLAPSKDIEPCILGKFICAGVKLHGSEHVHFVLFNWVDFQYMLFRLQSGQRVLTALIPGGHLLISVAEPITPGRQLLLLFSLETLRNHWRPIHNRIQYTEFVDVFDRIYLFERHPALMAFVDETEAWSARRWQLRVLEDVLCRDSYRILLYASDVVHAERARQTGPKQATLYSFHISLKRSSFVGWERISAVPAVPGVQNFSEISTYSGYCFARVDASIRLVSLRLDAAGEAAEQRIVDGLVAGLPNLNGVSVTSNGGLATFEKPSSGPPQMAVLYYS